MVSDRKAAYDKHVRALNTRLAAYELLKILRSYAPTTVVQGTLNDHFRKAIDSDLVSYEDIVIVLANELSNGLSTGNWPWNTWTESRDSKGGMEAEARTKEAFKAWKAI